MNHDSSIIRPQLNNEDIKNRGQGMSAAQLRAIKKGLQTLHTLELMAVTIYRFQITGEPSELNRQLTAAMCNEMTHYQDFKVKLYEYGFKPFKFRWVYWFVGIAFGLGSRILGWKKILKTGIWVEKKAVNHYQNLLESIPWDEETRKVIEKDRDDEKIHIETWTRLLQSNT